MTDVGEHFNQTLVDLASNYRAKMGRPTEPLTLVLPRWLYDQVGKERLTESFRRLGINRATLTEDYPESDRAQVLLYVSGTWHSGHDVGETREGCEGCEHA
jgi:hypothetical protein